MIQPLLIVKNNTLVYAKNNLDISNDFLDTNEQQVDYEGFMSMNAGDGNLIINGTHISDDIKG